MKLNNKIQSAPIFTAEGGKAIKTSDYNNLKRSVLATFLWEDGFYESGEEIAKRIQGLITKVHPVQVANLAIEAREIFKLRHVPLLLIRELARNEASRFIVGETLARVIQRPDELGEFLAIYNKEGKQPLAKQVKKGLAEAFKKFDEFQLSKWNRDAQYKLRDVLFLVHPVAKDKSQQKVWDKLVENKLATPDTWETELSGSKDKFSSWTRLLKENKLGAMALLKNLRNMQEAGVNDDLIRNSLVNCNPERVLPFRFVSAAKYAPQFEPELESLMFKCLKDKEKLKGKTALVVDVSGSMKMHKISAKSELDRLDAACALSMLLREVCEKVDIYTFSKETIQVPARRGFALKDIIACSQPNKDTYLAPAINHVNTKDYDRIICLTDEQVADNVPAPKAEKNYMINVASNKNGIGYGKGWNVHLDGWSEAIVDYISAIETNEEE